jgi:hypothetical protein
MLFVLGPPLSFVFPAAFRRPKSHKNATMEGNQLTGKDNNLLKRPNRPPHQLWIPFPLPLQRRVPARYA